MGGAEVFTREITTRWVKAGHQVTLFTAAYPNAKSEELVDGVRIVRSGGRFSVYLKAKKFYSERFRREGFDVIIDEINTRPFFAQKFADNGEKVLALIHQLAREYWFYETPFPISYLGYYLFENRWLRTFIDVSTVTVSQSTKQDLVTLGFKQVFVVPEGLNFRPLTQVSDKTKKPVIVYVGRLKRSKRPDHSIKAFRIVKQKIPEAKLWILGEGSFGKDLNKMAGEGVEFFVGLSNVERRDLLKKSWLLVNPSIREGWGLNVTEAAALGTPCVAYAVPGLRDSIKDEITGLLVENGNVNALAGHILQIIENDHLRRTLSENALKFSQEFNWTKTAEQFMKIIEGINTA